MAGLVFFCLSALSELSVWRYDRLKKRKQPVFVSVNRLVSFLEMFINLLKSLLLTMNTLGRWSKKMVIDTP